MEKFNSKLLSKSNTYKVYVLLLEDSKYYVGISKDVEKRFAEHCWGNNGVGSGFTKKFHPLQILEIEPTPYTDKFYAQELENKKTIELMKMYGIENVRGGEFCECDTGHLIRTMPNYLLNRILENKDKGGSILQEYLYEGNRYYFTGKKWIDEDRVSVPLSVVGKLNNLLLNDTDIDSMQTEELLNFAINLKDGENIQLAIRTFELLLEKNDYSITRQIMPRLVSSYRKVGKSEYAIKLVDKYCSLYKGKINSTVLFTTLAAAYCDIENYEEARRYANRARSWQGKNSSIELINVYSRIKQHDGGVIKKVIHEDVTEHNYTELILDKTAAIVLEKFDPKTEISPENEFNNSTKLEEKKIEFRNSNEYQAMNRIWKAIPSMTRNDYYNDFELVCKSLKKYIFIDSHENKFESQFTDLNNFTKEEYNYISSLSKNTQEFFYNVLNKYNLNIYHSIMAIIKTSKNYSVDDIEHKYFQKYYLKRPYIAENRNELREMIEYCYKKR